MKPRKIELTNLPGKWTRVPEYQCLAPGDYCLDVDRVYKGDRGDVGPAENSRWFRAYDEEAKRAAAERLAEEVVHG